MNDGMNNADATSPQQNAPILTFCDDAGNQINEISLAPGEQKKIKLILSDHPEAITQNFLAQWSVYDSKHQLTNSISCVMNSDSKKWLNPLCLSTTDESVGGMGGNDLNSARVDNGVWRCMGKNPNGQFWYPRDMYIPPVPVAEFVLMASSDWNDKYATFELDNNVTKFVLTTETGTPAANGNTVKCNYSMKLTVNNANAATVAPTQSGDGTTTAPTTPTTPTGSEGGTTEPTTPTTPTGSEGSTTTTTPPQQTTKPDPYRHLKTIRLSIECMNFPKEGFDYIVTFPISRVFKNAFKGRETIDVIANKCCVQEYSHSFVADIPLKTGMMLFDRKSVKLTVRKSSSIRPLLKDALIEVDPKRSPVGRVDVGLKQSPDSPAITIGESRTKFTIPPQPIKTGTSTGSSTSSTSTSSGTSTSGSQGRNVTDAERREAIRDGLHNTAVNPKMVLYNDTLFNEPKGTGATIYMKNGICYQLTNVNCPFTNKSVSVKGEDYGNIYPGAIVIADKNLSEGNPVLLNNVERSKIEIFGDFYSGKDTRRTIDVSSAGAVHDAIGSILRDLFGNTKYKPAKNTQFGSNIYSSKYEMMLSMGVDSSFCGCDLNVNVGVNKDECHFVQDTSLKQEFYTIRLNDDYRGDLSRLFGQDVTWDTIKKYTTVNGKVQPLAIITSVTYGRSVHYLKEYSSKSLDVQASMGFSGFGTDVDFKTKIVNSTEATNVNMISLGDGAVGGKLIKGSSGKKENESGENESGENEVNAIHEALAETSELGPDNQGIPLSYTIELLSGPTPVAIKPTFDGNFVETTELLACPSNYINLQVCNGIRNQLYMGAGMPEEAKTLKLIFKYKTFRLSQDKEGNYIKQPGNEYTIEDTYHISYDVYLRKTLQMGPGEYLDGYVRMDMYAGRPNDMTKYITDGLLDASSGEIKLKFGGYVLGKEKPYLHPDSPTKPLGNVGMKKE